MKKDHKDNELQQLWEENIGSLAYDLEEAFLEVFRKRGAEFQKPAFYLGAIAMAAGHVLQVTEEELGYQHDLKPSFDDILKQTYDYYKRQSENGEDISSPISLNIDLSTLN